MAEASPSIMLWIRTEPYNCGVLPTHPLPRLNHTNLKKIIAYAKSKGKQGYPRLQYPVWKHMACNKLALPEDIAWMYFQLYRCVRAEGADGLVEQDLEWNAEPKDEARAKASVDLLGFVLLLHAQQMHKISSLRSSLLSGEAEWPSSRSKSPELDGRSTPREHKVLDDHLHLTFVQQNLGDMMALLVEPESLGAPPNEQTISMGGVEALELFIAASVDRASTVISLRDLLLLQHIQPKVGYSKISQTFSVGQLVNFMKSHLTNNPFGISACIASGRRLAWPALGEEREGRGERSGKVASNAHLVPSDVTRGNKLTIVAHLNKRTVARQSSANLEQSSLKIHRCHHSTFYLLSPLRSVTIDKCRHVTVVLGAVETVVHVNASEGVTVIAPCRQAILSKSSRCTLHLLTPQRPLVTMDCSSNVLAPYHTHYGGLQQDMAASQLGPALNLWAQPLAFGTESVDEKELWEIMQPKDFFPFNIPFDVPGSTTSIPGGLPARYSKAVQQRERQLDQWQRTVRDSGLSRDQRKQLQSLVEHRFQEWLVDTGAKRELDSLAASAAKSKS